MSFSSNISSALNKKVTAGLTSAATGVADKLGNKLSAQIGGQIGGALQGAVANFSVAGASLLISEAINKIKGLGGAKVIKGAIGKNIGLSGDPGSLKVVNVDTNALLANLGPIGVEKPGSKSGAVRAAPKDNTEKFKVKLSARPKVGSLNQITFKVMPVISESQSAEYDSFSPLHHPGEIQKYKTTKSRNWSLEAKLISRTTEEATENLKYINLLRSWTMPFYGNGTQKAFPKLLGAPPPILTLSGYGDSMIGPISCVLERYDWRWPNDIDYIPTNNGEPFPVIVDISLTLRESWSPNEFSNFDLLHYKNGNMGKAFNGSNKSIENKGQAFASMMQGAQAAAAETDGVAKGIEKKIDGAKKSVDAVTNIGNFATNGLNTSAIGTLSSPPVNTGAAAGILPPPVVKEVAAGAVQVDGE